MPRASGRLNASGRTEPGSARFFMGLMSGTSADGIDAAVVGIDEGRRGTPGWAVLAHHTHSPFSAAMRTRVLNAAQSGVPKLCALNVALGEEFARAALKCMQEAGISAADIAAIGSHGQTVWHEPPSGKGRGAGGSTLQIGDAAVIAARTDCTVISDFRQSDMAQGGQGAPLVPLADYLLFSHLAPVAIHNLGGISNLTVLSKGRQDVMAFDTGPANSLMDEAARRLLGRPCDRGGKVAARGRVDERLLARLLRHPYFRRKPPKSTGRELFGPDMLDGILRDFRGRPKEDVLATLTAFTAQSIRLAYERFVLPEHPVREVIFSGGGTGNVFLMQQLRQELQPLRVSVTDDYGVRSEAREAMSFAILAHETMQGRAGNLPSVTGARQAVVLGKITPRPLATV